MSWDYYNNWLISQHNSENEYLKVPLENDLTSEKLALGHDFNEGSLSSHGVIIEPFPLDNHGFNNRYSPNHHHGTNTQVPSDSHHGFDNRDSTNHHHGTNTQVSSGSHHGFDKRDSPNHHHGTNTQVSSDSHHGSDNVTSFFSIKTQLPSLNNHGSSLVTHGSKTKPSLDNLSLNSQSTLGNQGDQLSSTHIGKFSESNVEHSKNLTVKNHTDNFTVTYSSYTKSQSNKNEDNRNNRRKGENNINDILKNATNNNNVNNQNNSNGVSSNTINQSNGENVEEYRSNSNDQSDEANDRDVSNNNNNNDNNNDNTENENDRSQEIAVNHIIEDVWKKIDESISKYRQMHQQKSYPNIKDGWRSIRIFISSTFTDFFAEREVIVKKVIPELQEWADEKKIQLIECDLRWGVPKNTSFLDTISMMMDELYRCIQETHGQPFFVCLMGERYGWVPTRQYVSDDIINLYDWVYPTSMTHMEVIHGALRTMSSNALFMIRDKQSISQVPQSHYRAFQDKSILAKNCLKRLKSEIRERFPDQTFDYTSRVSGIDQELGKVMFDDLEEFQRMIVDFFKGKIEDFIESTGTVSTESNLSQYYYPQDVYIQKQMEFSNVHAEEFRKILHLLGIEESESHEISTDAELQTDTKIDCFNDTTCPDNALTTKSNEIQHNNDKSSEKPNEARETSGQKSAIHIISPRGFGKASLLARTVVELRKKNIPCLYNFACSIDDSTTSPFVLMRFCKELSSILDNKELPEFGENLYKAYDKLVQCFHQLLTEISEKYPGFPIILHGLNYFRDNWGQNGDWLPVPCENEINVRYIISSTKDYGDNYKILTKKLQDFTELMELNVLDEKEKVDLICAYFQRFNKILDGEQMQELILRGSSASPLWLSLACEEIRIFGIYENLSSFIKNIPDSTPDLLASIFQRIIDEDETSKVKEVLQYLGIADGGLSETELRFLLSEIEDEQLPMLVWARVYRKVKQLLMNNGAQYEDNMYQFIHTAAHEVVRERFLLEKDSLKSLHQRVGNYFLRHGKDNYRTPRFLLTHLQKAGMVKELENFIRRDKRSFKVGHQLKAKAMNYFRCNRTVSSSWRNQVTMSRPLQAYNPFHNGRAGFNHSSSGSAPMVNHHPFTDMEQKLFICNSCIIYKYMSPYPGEVSDQCFICLGSVFLQKTPAVFCSQHSTRIYNDLTTCFFCQKRIWLKQPMYSPIHLCSSCSYGNKCVKIMYSQ